MSAFHLTYSQSEDRVLISVDQQEHGVALTRRLARGLLKTMASAVAQQKSGSTGGGELLRNAVLNFENSKALAESYAGGKARRQRRKAPDPGMSKVADAVDIATKRAGGLALRFRHGDEQLLTLNLDGNGAHVIMSSLCEIAAAAEWDFAEIAAWLESAPPRDQDPQARNILH